MRRRRRQKQPATASSGISPTEPRRFQLDGGEVGYGVDPFRLDDCLTAAIATAVQVDVAQVPDLRLSKRFAAGEDPAEISRSSWERLAHWAARRGLALVSHDELPADRERWIGVVEQDPAEAEAALDVNALCESARARTN